MPGNEKPRNPLDPDRAEDMLDEIQAVLRKRHMLLIHKPDCIVLAVRDTRGLNTWRPIAQVRTISPLEITWRPAFSKKDVTQ